MDSNYPTTLLKAILAGMMVSFSSISYLLVENHIIGAFLFSFGLFSIYTLNFYLFTGKAGYLWRHRRPDKLLLTWCGNLLGAIIVATLISQTRLVDSTLMMYNVTDLATTKISDTPSSLFILALFCGFTMYIAAETHQRTRNTANSIGGYITVILCVMVFMMAGFENSIADMFYFALMGDWGSDTIIAIITVSLGNAVGALVIPTFTLLMEPDH